MQNTQLLEQIKSTESSRAICVLGMHRSGTSAVTRIFNLLGVYLGKQQDIMPPAPDNPEGFWEHSKIVDIHDHILQTLGYSWDTTLPLPHKWWKYPEVKPLKEKLTRLILEEFSDCKLWGWKDPRTCILLPLWREILSELNIDLSFVIVTRNPLEVADSLTKRNGFPAVKGWAMWFLYTVNALYWSHGYERAFVSYEDLVQDWQNEIHQAATKLSLPWPEDERSFVRQVDGFIKPQLRHHRRSIGEAFLLLPKPISQLYEICLEKGEDCDKRYRLCAKKDERKSIAFKEDKYARAYASMLSVASTRLSSDYVPLAETDIPAESMPVKLIAFYLPQFHPIPENDKWWGRGFTEWTNVSKAVPQFVGHYQPHLPGELGFYDLRVPEVQRRQVELARKYGVYGFCFYYYWFSGKRLLERPLEQFVADSEIDFPFCLCWANENWTRRWDGLENEVLIAQAHSEESDFAFIRDIEPYLRHRRYIRIHGRPLLIVYRAQLLPDPAATAKRWKEYCREAGIGDLYLVAAQTFDFSDPREVGFDAAVEFPPLNVRIPEINHTVELLNPNFTGSIFRYTDVVEWMSNRPRPPYQLFKTVFPSWDNEARRPGRGHIFAFSSPDAYKRWLTQACLFALQDPDPEKNIVFINAWNEWAEGAHLEPDRRYGYAYLQATADVLQSLAKPEKKKVKPLGAKAFSSYVDSHVIKGNGKIAEMYLNTGYLLHEIKEQGTLSAAVRLINFVGQRPVFIWGAGSGGVRTLKFLESIGLGVEGFIDNDASKWGNTVMGLAVYSPARVKLTDTSDSLHPYVVIGSVYASEIAAQLKGLGLQEELDFCVNPLL